MNNLKTGFLLIALTALLVWIGGVVGGREGAIVAFGIALVMNGVSYWLSDRLVLRMYHAQPVTEAEQPELYGIVADLSQRMGVPMPKVYVIPSATPNAFATGRNPRHAAVAATEGILRMLDRQELTGVLAHELSHVTHRDILISSVAATVVGAIGILERMAWFSALFGGFGRSDDEGGNPFVLLVVLAVSAFAAMLIQLAISRAREFEADAGGARLLGTGEPLARALEKIEAGVQAVPMRANPATAHMFIVSPLAGASGVGGVISKLFRTHPPTEERIARLRNRTWAA